MVSKAGTPPERLLVLRRAILLLTRVSKLGFNEGLEADQALEVPGLKLFFCGTLPYQNQDEGPLDPKPLNP